MKNEYINNFDGIRASEEAKQKAINNLICLIQANNNTKSTQQNRFTWNIRRSIVAASVAAVLIFCAIFIPLMAKNSGQNNGFEWGFEFSGGGNSNEMPSYPYFDVYCAYRFSKTEFNIDNITVQFFYGHTLPNSYYDFDEEQYLQSNLKDAESETRIIINNKGDIWEGRGLELKQVDSFLSDNYAATMTWIDQIEHRYSVEYSHSEAISIPQETFIKEYGYFSICVRSDVTDESVKLISGEHSGTLLGSRGWGQGETARIYYYVKEGRVKLGKDYKGVIPKAYWNNI